MVFSLYNDVCVCVCVCVLLLFLAEKTMYGW